MGKRSTCGTLILFLPRASHYIARYRKLLRIFLFNSSNSRQNIGSAAGFGDSTARFRLPTAAIKIALGAADLTKAAKPARTQAGRLLFPLASDHSRRN